MRAEAYIILFLLLLILCIVLFAAEMTFLIKDIKKEKEYIRKKKETIREMREEPEVESSRSAMTENSSFFIFPHSEYNRNVSSQGSRITLMEEEVLRLQREQMLINNETQRIMQEQEFLNRTNGFM